MVRADVAPARTGEKILSSTQMPCRYRPAGFKLRTVFRRFGFLCAALAIFSIAGGHWAALQTVAWAEMLHDYTRQSGSLAVAVAQTFDGKHPCDLCRVIASAKAGTRHQTPAAPRGQDEAKVKALLAEAAFRPACPAPIRICLPRAGVFFGSGRTDPPPTPPPRPADLAA